MGNIDLRRAVLAILVDATGPRALGEIVQHLERVDGIDIAGNLAVSAHQRVSDLVRWQVAAGRVRRLRPGVYVYVGGSLSRTTVWRCRNWATLAARR